MKWISEILIAIIKFYKKIISPFFPPACRFKPTCSEYLVMAIKKRGIIQGLWLGLIRICKCNPFHPGGIDNLE